MVTSSKVLTVTYGTFSCTLEGFDDPFTTLQMVAEYFRKLAAEDRYFGGVPTVPDTDTLKRIAEENNPKGVAAEIGENGIILRQAGEDTASEDDVASEEDAQPAAEADEIVAEVDYREEPVEEDPVAEDDEATASPVTFFRSRRSHEADDDELDIADDSGDLTSIFEAPEQAPAKSVEETLAAIRQNVERAETEIAAAGMAAGTAEEEVLVDAPEEDEAEPTEAQIEPLVLTVEEQTDDVEQEDTDSPVDAEFTEDAPVAETLADLEEDADDERDVELDAVAVAMADAELEAEPDLEPATEEDVEAETEFEPVAEAEFEPAAEVETEAEVEVEADADAEFEEIAEPEAEVEEPVTRVSSLTDEQEAELARDLEEALEAVDADDEVDTQADKRRKERRARAKALRKPDDLAREEAALDRLLETTKSKMDKPEQARRLNALDQLKAAVAATEADQQVRDLSPVSSADTSETADLAAYREDLRRAQSKARLGGLQSGAKARPEQPPLILVSEQRIDEPPASGFETEEPIEPQREVAATDGNLALKPEPVAEETHIDEGNGEIQGIPADAFSESSSFGDFAERIGAFELQDLLEAAAAYTSIVEGQARFSRAQVMSKIAKLDAEAAFSKEAGLSSFGRLLREGKILRVQDGQFAISKASRFSIASRYET